MTNLERFRMFKKGTKVRLAERAIRDENPLVRRILFYELDINDTFTVEGSAYPWIRIEEIDDGYDFNNFIIVTEQLPEDLFTL